MQQALAGMVLLTNKRQGIRNTGWNGKRGGVALDIAQWYNSNEYAELCSGSTGDFESLSPGSNPGSAAMPSPIAQR